MIFEVFIIWLFDLMEKYLVVNGYRSLLFDRNGFDPFFKKLVYFTIGLSLFFVILFNLLKELDQYIKELTKSIQKISEGDFDSIIDVKGNDEFASIASGLNQMTEELKRLMENERLTEKSKNELIANVAHDLRTPLTSIIGYLELIRSNGFLDDETKKKYMDIVYNKAKRLEKLIEDLFDYTKLNHSSIELKLEKIDIVKLLEQLLDEFFPNFQKAGLTFEFYTTAPSIIMEADGNLLARLFDNLINNAIKYGSDGKVVEVRVRDEGEIVIIEVTNYGKVIPKNELGKIFQKFYRVEQSRSLNTGGTGLGLAIAKNVVEMHHGFMEARSDLNGTVFEVHFYKELKNLIRNEDSNEA